MASLGNGETRSYTAARVLRTVDSRPPLGSTLSRGRTAPRIGVECDDARLAGARAVGYTRRVHRHPGTRRRSLLGVLALLAAVVQASGCAHTPATPVAPRCSPLFPYQDGWLGGDAAYSVPLGAGESIWLFGDTFVRQPDDPERADRRGASFIHNSIGRSRCDEQGWSIEYHWASGPEGPAAFLDPGEPGRWWWLFDGFVHEERLYIGLLQLASSEPRGPLGMPFRFTGVDLARVENPHDAFEDWRVEILRLSHSDLALPVGAMVRHEDHLYLFTFLDQDARAYPRMLVRLPLSSLDGGARDLEPDLETLARDGSWKPGFDPTDARILMEDDATEMSVDHHPSLGAWIAVYSYPSIEGGFPETRPSDRVWVRTADSLEGPWSERKSLFRVPELDPEYAGGYDPNTACYAAKAHEQFSTPDQLTFTYVCNLFAGPDGDAIQVLLRLADDMGLYRPIPVSVTLPPELLER